MSRIHTHALGLGAVLAAGGLLLAAPPKPAAATPAGTVQDVIFFTADGPVRVRLTLTRNGRPFEAGWDRAVDGLFAYLDRDGNGTLEAGERTIFNRTRGLNLSGDLVVIDGTGYVVPRDMSVTFAVTDGKVGRPAFRDGFRASRFGPVTVEPVQPRGDSAALSAALFKHLDTDGDGKLSAAELKAARARLAPLDVNEDELITPDELLRRVWNSDSVYASVVFSADGRFVALTPPPLADVLVAPTGRTATARDVLAARDKDKDGTLTAAELGCPPAALAGLDADGDGRLDADELAAWLRRPPDLDLSADLSEYALAVWGLVSAGRVRDTAPVLLRPGSRMAGRVTADADGSVRLATPAVRLRVAADPGAANNAKLQWRQAQDSLRAGFRLLGGRKGEVERRQLTGVGDLGGAVPLFDLADRDRDGTVTRAELDALVAAYDPLVACRAEVTIADRGRGLFELLDRDGDGRLSPRELNAAEGLLAALDRDGDGKLSRDELPHRYEIVVRPAGISVLPNADVTFFELVSDDLTLYPAAVRSAAGRAAVPDWFRKMDRNGDGDVSAREFVGPPALFRKIDADGDGLISPAEARAYEKTVRRPPGR
jgi:Ca2+-binding EF-hand superfamily protein